MTTACRLLTAFTAALMTCLVPAAAPLRAAEPQASPASPAKPKETEERKPAKVDVRLLVTTGAGEPVTKGAVKLGMEEACSKPNEDEPAAKLDELGEARFRSVSACSVTVITSGVDGYIFFEMEVEGKKQQTRIVNLAEHKGPIKVFMKKR